MKVQERLLQRFGERFPSGSVIFREGDQGDAVYYILSGRVQIEKAAGRVKKILAIFNPGDYFGEMAAFILSTRTATARAVADSYIAVIDRATFHSLLRDSGEVSSMMLEEFAKRLKLTSDSLDQISQQNSRLKAALFLLNKGINQSEPVRADDLALYLKKGLDEAESVLKWLENEGVITLEDGRVISVDEQALLTLVEEL